ncbi:DUF397 domain-containing protein [Amycolatopsis sp. NPDC051903]|uniref:DUF397 domain-containing protein n=1 Tax=Amycolatopsis sp. NPDC051903 TaxID=3363936 RepID=UPI0037AC5324
MSTAPDYDPTRWRKSRHSGDNGGCVEVNDSVPGVIGIRDSKLGSASPVLTFYPHEIANFFRSVNEGEFDNLIG